MNQLHYMHSWSLDEHIDKYLKFDGKDFRSYFIKILSANEERRRISLQIHKDEFYNYLTKITAGFLINKLKEDV